MHIPVLVTALLDLLSERGHVRFFNDGNNLQMLRDRLAELNQSALDIRATADAATRDFTSEEAAQLDGLFAQIEETESQIELRERIEANAARFAQAPGRRTEPTDPPGEGTPQQPTNRTSGAPRDRAPVPAQARVGDGRRGFRNIGDFARSVYAASRPGGAVDPRLIVDAPSSFGQEGVGADGGFAVPPDFRTAIQELIMGEDSLLPRTDLLETTSNTLVLPKDETAPWDSANGIQAYWEGEGAQGATTKPHLSENTIKLNKLFALVPATSELLEDAAALGSYINRKAPERINFKVNLSLVQGTGVGQPLGFLKAPGTVSVAKESGQASATLLFENITKMFSRMYAPSRPNAVWLVNQDVEQQLYTMQFPVSSGVTAVPAFLPPGGLSASPYATLMGRPVIPSQAMNTLGQQGDIAFVDLKQYLAAQKVGGIRSEMSIHLYFDYDQTAFRFIFRLAGQPWRSTPIQPRSGSNTLSSFVVLDAR